MHPQEHKGKTINYILTPAVKSWHFVLNRKKVEKSVSLNQGNVGKGHPASGASSTRKLTLRFLVEAANSTEREVAANSNTVCFHTQEQTVCTAKASEGLGQLPRTEGR